MSAYFERSSANAAFSSGLKSHCDKSMGMFTGVALLRTVGSGSAGALSSRLVVEMLFTET